MKTHPLVRALRELFREARFEMVGSRDWHSLTFSGQQLSIECALPAPDTLYGNLADMLPTHEFSIAGCLVADIAVVSRQSLGGQITLLIEALIIFQ